MKSTRSRVSVNPGEFRQQVGCMMIIQYVADWQVLWDDDEHDFGGKLSLSRTTFLDPWWVIPTSSSKCAICETSKKGFHLFRTPRLKMAGRNSVERPSPCKFPWKVALLTCWCAFRRRRLAQSLQRGFGLRHFSCKFPYKVAVVQCPSAVRLRRLAQKCGARFWKGAFTHRRNFTQKSFYTQKLLHGRLYTQEPLHFTQKSFYTEEPLHTKELLHTDENFTQKSFCTEELLQKEELLHKEVFRQKNLYAETRLHRRAFTQKSFYTQKLLRRRATEEFLHTEAFTHKSFYTEELLHRESFRQKRFYTE